VEQQPPSPSKPDSAVLLGRRFLTCSVCGWVHYAMTPEEKTVIDQLPQRYRFSAAELALYESTYRQCLRCESPAADFRDAADSDMARAEGHLVTPVFVDPEAGMN
jgi:hypothetical protein